MSATDAEVPGPAPGGTPATDPTPTPTAAAPGVGGDRDATTPEPRPGRSRTREAAVAAMLELVAEGDLQPRGRTIAARADVSLRSLYHHFADLDELLAEAASRVFATIDGLQVDPDPDRPLAERITDFVDVRARTLEAMGNFWRAALIAATTSEAMRANMVRGRNWLRRRIRDQFAPELAMLPEEAAALRLDALQVITSAAAWDLLRTELGLSVDRARRVMDLNVRAALGPGLDGQGSR